MTAPGRTYAGAFVEASAGTGKTTELVNAIAAAVADLQNPKNRIDNHIRVLTDRIEQAVEAVHLKEADMSRKALLSNIYFGISTLNQSRPVLIEAVKLGHLNIIGAVYDVNTGKVDWLGN